MSLKLTVNLKNYPQGAPIGITGLGVVNNGGTLDVTPEMEASFFAERGVSIEDSLKDQAGMSLSGSAEYTEPEASVVTQESTSDENPQLREGGES